MRNEITNNQSWANKVQSWNQSKFWTHVQPPRPRTSQTNSDDAGRPQTTPDHPRIPRNSPEHPDHPRITTEPPRPRPKTTQRTLDDPRRPQTTRTTPEHSRTPGPPQTPRTPDPGQDTSSSQPKKCHSSHSKSQVAASSHDCTWGLREPAAMTWALAWCPTHDLSLSLMPSSANKPHRIGWIICLIIYLHFMLVWRTKTSPESQHQFELC